MHQAFWFGLISGALAVAALLWPLLASFVISNVTITIWVYAIALLLDGGLLTWWFVLAARYSRRAAHGDLFDVPWVSRLTGSTSRNR